MSNPSHVEEVGPVELLALEPDVLPKAAPLPCPDVAPAAEQAARLSPTAANLSIGRR